MDYGKLYINGRWIEADSNKFIDVENPSNKEIIGRVPRANEKDINYAIQAANEAFDSWKETDPGYRVEKVKSFLNIIKETTSLTAEIITDELGSTLVFSKLAHIESYFDDIEYFIEIAKNYTYEEKFDGYIQRKEPVGVVGALTPWNYPFGQVILKIIPALLAGNTIVLKPSKTAPMVSYHIADALDKAGFPAGVFNMVTGIGREVGDIISRHDGIDMISFTGSTKGGVEVGKEAIKTVKLLALELGGKSPSIIMEGGDLDLAVKTTLSNTFNNSGQTCTALSRIVADRKIKDELEELLIKESEKYTVGHPRDKESRLGPVASESQFKKISYYIDKGLEEGAEILVGERAIDSNQGYFIKPVIFTEMDNDMEIAREEIFGPVTGIIYYDSIEEAISIANDTKYGLSAAVFGPEKESMYLARRIESGQVKMNGGVGAKGAAFGGYKMSGLGREKGKLGFEEFLENKVIFI